MTLLIITRQVGDKIVFEIDGKPVTMMVWAARVQSEEVLLQFDEPLPDGVVVMEGPPSKVRRKKQGERKKGAKGDRTHGSGNR